MLGSMGGLGSPATIFTFHATSFPLFSFWGKVYNMILDGLSMMSLSFSSCASVQNELMRRRHRGAVHWSDTYPSEGKSVLPVVKYNSVPAEYRLLDWFGVLEQWNHFILEPSNS